VRISEFYGASLTFPIPPSACGVYDAVLGRVHGRRRGAVIGSTGGDGSKERTRFCGQVTLFPTDRSKLRAGPSSAPRNYGSSKRAPHLRRGTLKRPSARVGSKEGSRLWRKLPPFTPFEWYRLLVRAGFIGIGVHDIFPNNFKYFQIIGAECKIDTRGPKNRIEIYLELPGV